MIPLGAPGDSLFHPESDSPDHSVKENDMQTSQQPLGRKQWTPVRQQGQRYFYCRHCELEQRDHINAVYCPEWALRQLDGDR